MKLAFIAPICALNEISSLGDIEFCLAPYLKNNKYREYFNNASRKRRYIIIDNGIAEAVLIPSKELVNEAISIKAKEIIIPDVIGDYKASMRKNKRFLEEFYPILKKNKIKIQGVIQGNTIYQYIRNVLELEDDNRVDIIGIPFRMHYAKFNNTTKEENHMWNRLMFLQCCQIDKPIHLLGNNLSIELLWASKVRSCDSKLMARYGMNNKVWNFDDLTKPKKKLYITSKMTTSNIKNSILNIEKLRKELG